MRERGREVSCYVQLYTDIENIQISDQLSVCAWINPLWTRWYPGVEVFNVKTTERLISCHLKENKKKGILDIRATYVIIKNEEYSTMKNLIFKTNDSFAIHQMLRFLVYLIFCALFESNTSD